MQAPAKPQKTCPLCAGACQADFIRVQNGVFVQDDCREWHFSGYNTWQVRQRALSDNYAPAYANACYV